MTEYDIHRNICNYLRLQYPNTIFTSDASGIRMSIGNARKMLMLKSKHKIPDLLIFEPKGNYHGLILEIKKDDAKVFKKDGELYSNEHIRMQELTLFKLRKKGYKAEFAIGYDHGIELITNYMRL